MEVAPMTEMMSRVENTQDDKPVTGLDGLDEHSWPSWSTARRPAGCQARRTRLDQ
jgi:hypothetical protein